MKGKLEFDLPMEQEQFQDATDAHKMRLVLSEMDKTLMRRVKYAPDTQSKELTDAYEQLRSELRTLLEDEGIKL